MLTTAQRFLRQEPMLAIIPGVAISLTVLAFNLLGDVLRDLLDPRLRGAD
jgi:peptide/nickel transport system permease protein